MAQEPERDKPTLYLHKIGINSYVIRNKIGTDLTPVRRFDGDTLAVEWAKAWSSSWLIVELKCLLRDQER